MLSPQWKRKYYMEKQMDNTSKETKTESQRNARKSKTLTLDLLIKAVWPHPPNVRLSQWMSAPAPASWGGRDPWQAWAGPKSCACCHLWWLRQTWLQWGPGQTSQQARAMGSSSRSELLHMDRGSEPWEWVGPRLKKEEILDGQLDSEAGSLVSKHRLGSPYPCLLCHLPKLALLFHLSLWGGLASQGRREGKSCRVTSTDQGLWGLIHQPQARCLWTIIKSLELHFPHLSSNLTELLLGHDATKCTAAKKKK